MTSYHMTHNLQKTRFFCKRIKDKSLSIHLICDYFKFHGVHLFHWQGITNDNVIKIYKIAPNHFQQQCSIVCPNQQGKKRKKEEEDNGSKLPQHVKKILNLYIIEEEMGFSIESVKDSSQFSCLCCYPTYLVNTLRSIAFFGVPINCELVIIDMCNCVSPWT